MNYLSRPYSVENPVSRGDLNVDFQVLNTLQTRYDANKAIVDQTLAQYEMLKGIRPSDNEYIANKLTQVKSKIDSYNNLRFEHRSTVDSLSKTLQNVLKDPIVRDAVQSKAIKDSYDTQVSEISKKSPDKYNDANYQYGLYQGGYQEYLQGKTNKLKSLSYTPYTDLNKEVLAKLKDIKVIKGKRHIEEIVDESGNVNPNGKRKRTKEIDGLTQDEISSYFGNLLTSQELNQIKIDGWAKYAQPSTIEASKKIYGDYHNQLIKNKEENLTRVKANANNKHVGEHVNKEYLRKAEELQYEIDNLKATDLSKISSDEIAFQLEKTGYISSISKMAASEWSTSLDVNDIYYKDRELELDYKNYDLKLKELKLKEIELAQEFGVDPSGNPLADNNIAKSAKSTDLEDLTETSAGIKNLEKDQNTAYNNIVSTASEFLKNAPKEDKENFLKYLKARGVNEELKFENGQGKSSLVNEIYEAFKEGGFDSSYADYSKTMDFNMEIKRQKAKDMVSVESISYKKVFNKDPDKYISFLQRASEDLKVGTYIPTALNPFSMPVGLEKKALSAEIEGFVKEAGGWKNLKNYLSTNPEKLSKFADLTDKADKEFKGAIPILKNAASMANIGTSLSTFMDGSHIFQSRDRNLKEDASGDIEKLIQERTSSGLMTSVYSDFTFTNDKVKESVLKMIPSERTFVKGSKVLPALLDRSKTANTSFYKNGEEIIVVQESKVKAGEPPMTTETRLTKGDAGFQELLKYVDFESQSKNIKATADTQISPVRIRMASFENDKITRDKKQNSVLKTLTSNPNLQEPFKWMGADRVRFAQALETKDTAIGVVDQVLTARGIPEEKVIQFKESLFQNINSFKVEIKSVSNIDATGYTFGVDVKKGDDTILFTQLGTNELDENTSYLVKSHPQVIFLNELLKTITKDNVDNYINRF